MMGRVAIIVALLAVAGAAGWYLLVWRKRQADALAAVSGRAEPTVDERVTGAIADFVDVVAGDAATIEVSRTAVLEMAEPAYEEIAFDPPHVDVSTDDFSVSDMNANIVEDVPPSTVATAPAPSGTFDASLLTVTEPKMAPVVTAPSLSVAYTPTLASGTVSAPSALRPRGF